MCNTDKIKKRLHTYRSLCEELEQIKERLDEMENSQDMVKSVVISDIPKGNNVDRDLIGKLLSRIEEVRKQYNEKLDKMLCELHYIEMLIDSLEEPTERRLMRKRYIEGKEWSVIAKELFFSQETAWRTHRKILLKLSKMTVDDS